MRQALDDGALVPFEGVFLAVQNATRTKQVRPTLKHAAGDSLIQRMPTHLQHVLQQALRVLRQPHVVAAGCDALEDAVHLLLLQACPRLCGSVRHCQ